MSFKMLWIFFLEVKSMCFFYNHLYNTYIQLYKLFMNVYIHIYIYLSACHQFSLS